MLSYITKRADVRITDRVNTFSNKVVVVQLLSRVWLFATPWTTVLQASLSIINSRIPPKPMSIVSVMPFNRLILCHPLLLLPSIFPSISVFSSESALHIRWPSIGVSASTPVLPMNTQDWSPLGWTGWISLQSKGLSRIFSNTTVQKHQFFSGLYKLKLKGKIFCILSSWIISRITGAKWCPWHQNV